jgi:ABC-type transport system involved in cytochrome bd biosynthesis fused ATPase/permease subunit
MIEELNNDRDATFYIIMNIMCQIFGAYIQLQLGSHRIKLSHNISKSIITEIFVKVLRIDYTKLLEEKIQKIFWTMDKVVNDITYFIFEAVDVAIYISQNIVSCFIILTVSIKGFLIFVGLNVIFYVYYRAGRNKLMVLRRKENNEKARTIYNEIECSIRNLFDNVIHNEIINSVQAISDKRQSVEQLWSSNDTASDVLNFYQNAISRAGILICYVIASNNHSSGIVMLALITNMQQMVQMWNRIMTFHSNTSSKKQNFLKIQEYMELAERFTRRTFTQSSFTQGLTLSNLMCTLKGKDRRDFVLSMRPSDSITLNISDVVHIKGESGHGKSTFYNVLSGISEFDNTHLTLLADNTTRVANGFYQLMDVRTIVMQDYGKYLDFDNSWYNIIVGNYALTESEHINKTESKIIEILQMVNLYDIVQTQFDGDLHKKVGEHKLSGGQKTKLGLAKVIYRILKKQPKLIIFDEPDNGLPLAECQAILNRIIQLFKNNSIILITTHMHELELQITKTLIVKNGVVYLN